MDKGSRYNKIIFLLCVVVVFLLSLFLLPMIEIKDLQFGNVTRFLKDNYHNYTVKDLSQVDLESLLGEYEHKLIFITDEKQSQIFFVIRTSDEFLGFIFTENIESEPTIAYYYNFVDNEWYDINENELNEIPEIIFKNGYILSAEQIKELTGTEFNLFSEEIIDSLFTITSIE